MTIWGVPCMGGVEKKGVWQTDQHERPVECDGDAERIAEHAPHVRLLQVEPGNSGGCDTWEEAGGNMLFWGRFLACLNQIVHIWQKWGVRHLGRVRRMVLLHRSAACAVVQLLGK